MCPKSVKVSPRDGVIFVFVFWWVRPRHLFMTQSFLGQSHRSPPSQNTARQSWQWRLRLPRCPSCRVQRERQRLSWEGSDCQWRAISWLGGRRTKNRGAKPPEKSEMALREELSMVYTWWATIQFGWSHADLRKYNLLKCRNQRIGVSPKKKIVSKIQHFNRSCQQICRSGTPYYIRPPLTGRIK